MNNPFKSKTTLMGYMIGGAFVCTQAALWPLSPAAKAWVLSIGGTFTAAIPVIGHFQKDAGEMLADVPGQASPEVVPSHETPDDPNAKPIIPSSK